MIRIHLSRILGEKRWYQSDLSRKTGIRPNTINLLYNEVANKIKLSDLSLICEALNCRVSDILEYVPDAQER